MSVRPVPSVMLRATCSRFSDWPEYHCSPSLDTPASPFPAPRLPGHAPASPAPCQFRLLCFTLPASPFPLHAALFPLQPARSATPVRALAPRPAGFEAMLFGTKLAGPSCCTWRHIVLYYETQTDHHRCTPSLRAAGRPTPAGAAAPEPLSGALRHTMDEAP